MRTGLGKARSILIVALVGLSAPVIFWAAAKALATNSNEILDWLPQNFEETQRLIWFAERFGTDEIVAVGWDGCSLADDRVDQFVNAARDATDATTGKPVFGDVTSGRHVLQQLMEPPLQLPEKVALRRLQDWLIGEAGQTCVIARVNVEQANPSDGEFRLEALGEVDRVAAVARLREIGSELGLDEEKLHIAGPTVDSVAIDLAGRQWTIPMGAASVFMGCALAWLCLRSGWQVIAVFATSLIAAGVSLAVVHFSGNEMDAVLMTMPAIVFVLATSGGIHLTHYLNEALKTGATHRAPWQAVRAGIIPCSLACVTTAIGLASLAISRVRPVTRFGIFSSIGVAACLFLLLVFWPSLTELLIRRLKGAQKEGGETVGLRMPEQDSIASESGHGKWWEPLYGFTTRFSMPIVAISAMGLAVLGFGLTQINASVHLKNLLPGHSNLLQSYAWLEQEIGPMVPVEIVLQFHRELSGPEEVYERARIVEALRERVASLDRSGGTVGATTFTPDFHPGTSLRSTAIRTLMKRRMHRNVGTFEELGFIRDDDKYQLWRISTRASASELDYATFLRQIEETVNECLQEENARLSPEQQITSKICGAVPLIQMAQKQLLSDFIWSLGLAFVLIGLTIVLLLRSPSAGLVSMVPNVFPTVVVFGWMGLKGTPIDIGTMMTASVALGVAVDDTLHFLVWVRREVLRGKSRKDAIRTAFAQSATAMVQTSVICGMGMIPFVVSPFGPIAGFAGMMFALLMMALVGDLVLLPALIASPIGRSFMPRERNAG